MNQEKVFLNYFETKGYTVPVSPEGEVDYIKILVAGLNEENSSSLFRFNDFTGISVQEVPFDNILLNKLYYNTCVLYDEAQMSNLFNKATWVSGVLIKNRGQYRLVDGYHRFKYMKELRNISSARFIILS